MSSAQKRIYAAIASGLIIVGGAFYLSLKDSAANEAKVRAGELSDSSLTRKHIPVTDSNDDGVPDWQANIIKTEPIYIDASSTEPYVPGDTVSEQFAMRWTDNLMALEAYGLLDNTSDVLIDSAIQELEDQTKEHIYTRDDLKIVSTNNPGALRAYGNLVGGTIFYGQVEGESEYTLFENYMESENPEYLEKLADYQTAYENIIADLLELEVPELYVFEQLAVLNSLSAMKENVVAMQKYPEDPLYTTMRYRGSFDDVLGMNKAIVRLYDELYLEDGVQFEPNDSLRILAELLKAES